ncbi:unnamed protein product, partial [Choristocarpus tenellus]
MQSLADMVFDVFGDDTSADSVQLLAVLLAFSLFCTAGLCAGLAYLVAQRRGRWGCGVQEARRWFRVKIDALGQGCDVNNTLDTTTIEFDLDGAENGLGMLRHGASGLDRGTSHIKGEGHNLTTGVVPPVGHHLDHHHDIDICLGGGGIANNRGPVRRVSAHRSQHNHLPGPVGGGGAVGSSLPNDLQLPRPGHTTPSQPLPPILQHLSKNSIVEGDIQSEATGRATAVTSLGASSGTASPDATPRDPDSRQASSAVQDSVMNLGRALPRVDLIPHGAMDSPRVNAALEGGGGTIRWW